MEDPPRLYRSSDDKLVAGVAGGLAEHLGLSVLHVRLGFAALTVVGGLGILLYGVFWTVVPQQPRAFVPRHRPTGRPPRQQLVAMAALALGGLLVVREVGVWLGDAVVWPVLVAAVGAGLVWRSADDAARARWVSLPSKLPPATALDLGRAGARPLVGGAVLVVFGVAGFLAANDELDAARDGFVAITAVVAGLALVSAPWWRRLASDLDEERRARIRAEERAALAVSVHDSVLQTLHLVQRAADSPGEVRRLARTSERELRGWLYGAPPAAAGTRLRAALEAVAAEVEDVHGLRVEVVAVGDADLDEALSAMVLAARECLVNAAKFAGVAEVAVYAEVEPDRVSVFVRDAGPGFDLDAVPPDRKGLAESVLGRLSRVGGKATVHTAPGRGTEVELVLERVGS